MAARRSGVSPCTRFQGDDSSRSPAPRPAWPPPARWQPAWRRGVGAATATETGIRTVPTFCDMCFWQLRRASPTCATASCGSSRATRSTRSSRGRLCPRGTGAVGAHYDPDRLQPAARARRRARQGAVGGGDLGRGARPTSPRR
ncbi:MAG: hypothetical protein MZV64_30785 [Ignavibacteriales bacterium]|nr:hypothetical protein [Ignavibacteriales bacterium]